MNLGRLCDGDIFNPIEIEIWDHHKSGDHNYIGINHIS